MIEQVLNRLLDEVNVYRIEVTEDKISIFTEVKEKKEIVGKYRVFDPQKYREGILRMARARTKDERIKAVLDAHPDLTFKEWFEKEYPDKDYATVLSYIHNHPEMSIRNCIDNSGKRND